VVVVMMGLPGSGKSTIAQGVAEALRGVVVSKDEVRAAAFPEPVRDYSEEQDDLAMEMVYQACGYILRVFPGMTVVIDGRTFSKEKQVIRVLAWAASVKTAKRFVECVCDDETARERLRERQASAGNRDFELYRGLKKEADALAVQRLVVDTGKVGTRHAVQRTVAYVRGQKQ
jgi:predicted kinase